MPVRTVTEHWTKDGVAARVSPELRRGVRGGGRIRDEIIGHVIRVESTDFAKGFHTLDHAWEMEDKDLSGEAP